MRSPFSIIALVLVAVVGCGEGNSTKPTAATNSTKPAEAGSQVHPAAVAARSFLEVSAKGNEAAVIGLLTPLAAEQLQKSGQRVACLGDDSAKFQVTRWVIPTTDEAAVEFRMEFTAEGEMEHIDGVCFLKNVEGAWRVAGMAFDPGDDSDPLVVNYEQDLTKPQPSPNPAGTVQNAGAGSEVPQTAQNPGSTQTR